MAYFLMGSGMCFVNALCDVLPALLAPFAAIPWLGDPMCCCPGSQHQTRASCNLWLRPWLLYYPFCSSFLFSPISVWRFVPCTVY